MADSDAFIADYTDCTNLRDQHHRLARLQYGSTNISDNGHPGSSGVIDRNTLCVFRPRDKVCTEVQKTARPSQLAVRRQTVKQQLDGSFRSFERQVVRKVEQNNRLQQARCAQLLSNA